MILALSLALAAQTPAPGAAAMADVLDAVVARSNRLTYDLPESAITYTVTQGGKTASAREARRGEMTHGQLREDDVPTIEFFTDGKKTTLLDFDEQTYSENAVGARLSFDESTKTPLPPLEENEFQLQFQSSRGVILRASPGFRVVADDPAVALGEGTYRRLTVHGEGLAVAGDAGARKTIDLRAFVDTAGIIRRIEAELKSPAVGDAPAESATSLYVCEPKVPADEPFTFDVARLVGWKKIAPEAPSHA